MRKEYITILDSEKNGVYTYYVDINEIMEKYDKYDDLESWIYDIGHNASNCQWLVHKDKPIECISGEYKSVVNREEVQKKIESRELDSLEIEKRAKNEMSDYELNELEEYESGYRDGLNTALRYIQ